MEKTLERLMKTPEKLLESLNHPIFKQLTLSPIGVLDVAGEFIYFNQAAEEITGYSEKEILGVNILRFVTPAAQEVANVYKTMKPGLLAEHVVIEWVKADGNSCYIEWKSTTLYNKEDSPEYYFIIGEDVTSHRQNVLDIKHANQQFRDIVLGSSDFIWHLDSQRKFSYCSPGVTILGYSTHELLGKSLPDFPPLTQKAKSPSGTPSPLNTQESTTHSAKHKQGHAITCDTSFSIISDHRGKLKGYRGISRDITEHNKLVVELNESERRHQHSQKGSNFGIWEWNMDTGALYWSDQVWPVFGLDKAAHEPSLEIFMNCIHPDDREKMTNTIHETTVTNQQFDIEYRIIWPDDSIHWIKSTGNVIHRENGLTMAGMAIDIDRQKLAEQKLAAYEYRYQQLFQYSSDAILISDRQGSIIDSNLSLQQLVNRNKGSLHGKSLIDLCIHCCPNCHAIPIESQLAYGKVSTCETSIIQSDGSTIPVEIRRSSIEIEEQLIIQAIVRDLRPLQQKELEEKKLFEEQRAALVREVHHRIKNNLQGMIGLMRYNQNKKFIDSENIISQAVNQLHSMALVFGIQGQTGSKDITLESLITTIAQNQIKPKNDFVELTTNTCEPLSINEPDIIPFCLILNELIVNALKYKKNECSTVAITYQCKDKKCENNKCDGNKSAIIYIFTPGGVLPPNFDFATRRGFGTGLGLVSSLMPQQGMEIRYKQTNEGVETLLLLTPPVINP